MSDAICDKLQALQDAKAPVSDVVRALRNESYQVTDPIQNGKIDESIQRYLSFDQKTPPEGIDPLQWTRAKGLLSYAIHCNIPDDVPIVGIAHNWPVTDSSVGLRAEQEITQLFEVIRRGKNDIDEINTVLKDIVEVVGDELSKKIIQKDTGIKGVTPAKMQKLLSTAIAHDYNRCAVTPSNYLVDQASPSDTRVGNYEAYVDPNGDVQLRRKTNPLSAK